MKKNKKTEALNIKVSKEIKNKLEAIALKRDISLSQVVREYIFTELFVLGELDFKKTLNK